jgi:hypothetical protein
MSREKAKEILYKHEEKNHGAINHWQAAWILDAMIEYNESIVKSNSVLSGVSNHVVCDECGDTGRGKPTLQEPDGIGCEKCSSK